MGSRESALWATKKIDLLRAVRQQTNPNGTITWGPVVRATGMAYGACRMKWRELCSEAETAGTTVEELVSRESVPRPKKPDDGTLDALAPLVYPAPKLKPTAKANTDITMVAGDFHWGEDTGSPECEEIFLDCVKDLAPGTIVLNGDLPDLLGLSRFPKDYRTKNSLAFERRAMFDFLHRLRTVAPAATIIETNANHSGNGIESRWSRYLSERIPELMEDPDLHQRFSYQAVFHPEWASLQLVDYHVICPGLIAIHGDVVRGHAAYSARAMLEKWRISLIHGHTHRAGYYGYRVPAVAGKREHQMRAFEGACMCRLTAPYLSVANWQQGFSIVRHDLEGNFGIEQVLIHEGVAVVSATGNRYVAAA